MTNSLSRSKARICTFYSYKGGVGRSMALANVAVLMAQWGYRVLVVDWDLEAPGLDRYLEDLVPGEASPTFDNGGIVEMAKAVSDGREPAWNNCVVSFPVRGAHHALDFIPAGRRDSEYTWRLQQLDWEELFLRYDFGSRLETIRNDWLKTYDHVLIDSRTGITDIGGICTIYLPDIIVAMFTSNRQSIEGVAEVIGRARRARSNLPVDRGALACIPLPARDESRTEYEQSLVWRRKYEEHLGAFYTDFLPRDVNAVDALDLLRIPNVPYWSFGERLPVLTESPLDPSSITYYYTILARLLITELSWRDSAPPYATRDEAVAEAPNGETPAELVTLGVSPRAQEPVGHGNAAADFRLSGPLAADVAFLVELGGSQAHVERRIGLVRSFIGQLKITTEATAAVRVAVIGYREHFGAFRLGAREDREALLVGCAFEPIDAVLRELDREELWRAVPPSDDLAAPIEDALHLLRSMSWRPGVRHVVVILGSRPPHPAFAGLDSRLMTPCPHRFAWEDDLSALRKLSSVACLAVLDGRRDGGNYNAKSWAQLGEEGTFTGNNALERLLQAVAAQPIVQPYEPVAPDED